MSKNIDTIKYKQTDWINYRSLKKGEIIEKYDEILIDGKGWKEVNPDTIGYTAPDPSYTSHRIYRRHIRKEKIKKIN